MNVLTNGNRLLYKEGFLVTSNVGQTGFAEAVEHQWLLTGYVISH